MSSSKVHTVLSSRKTESIITTPTTSITALNKPTWDEKPHFQSSKHGEEEFNDIGDNWSGNGWSASDPFKDPNPHGTFESNDVSWGTGPHVEIPAFHTHFTVLDSMDQQSGYTHYLLESNRGMLFHGHQSTKKWTLLSKTGGDGSEFASLPDLTHVPADFLFPLYHPSMTKFRGNPEDEAVYMKQQAFLSRTKYKSTHYADCTAREISRCERISASPHPNLARYLGVETRVIGGEERVLHIAYERYSMDLHTFVLVKRFLRPHHASLLLQGVERGMRHLHALGLVHCDLRPMNVFVTIARERDEKGDVVVTEVVLGDFDASVPVGEEVSLKRASGDWWPEGVEWGVKAVEWIDEWCLERLGKWMKEEGLGEWDFGGEQDEIDEVCIEGLAGDILEALPVHACW